MRYRGADRYRFRGLLIFMLIVNGRVGGEKYADDDADQRADDRQHTAAYDAAQNAAAHGDHLRFPAAALTPHADHARKKFDDFPQDERADQQRDRRHGK